MYKINKSIAIASLCLAFATSAMSENLVIVHTNDTHSQIDPLADTGLGGVARRKVLIDSIRNANENVLVIDAGDIVQGTLFFNLYKGEVEEKIMNALGYDMRILGNHEFDNGMQALADNLKTADAELLSSNYDFSGTPLEGFFKPYTIKEIDGKKIAFMPINLQPKGMISPLNYEGLKYIDAAETAEHLAWYLKNIEGADIVVAITHIGYDDDTKILEQSTDIDLLIGGHSHTLVNPTDDTTATHRVANAEGRDILIAQTGRYGQYLGEITIDLDSIIAAQNGSAYVPKYQLFPVDQHLDAKVDGQIEEIVAPYRESVNRLNTHKVAKTARALDKEEPGLLNFISDFVYQQGAQMADVDLSIMNKGGLRNSLPKGDVTEGQIITILPFFNYIQVIEVPGDKLIQAFDTMAKADGNGVSQNVKAKYRLSDGKCTEVLIDGQPIDPERTYRVATINYLADGGDYMTALVDSKHIAQSTQPLFDDLLDYLTKGKGKGKKINPSNEPRMINIDKAK